MGSFGRKSTNYSLEITFDIVVFFKVREFVEFADLDPNPGDVEKIFFGSYSKFRHQKILATFSCIMDLFVDSEISAGPVEISMVEISGIEISENFY